MAQALGLCLVGECRRGPSSRGVHGGIGKDIHRQESGTRDIAPRIGSRLAG